MDKSKNSILTKILSVILGALVGGFMWRCRGEGGWGSSWGLYAVGFALMLVIFHFYSDRKGMRYEMIPVGAFMLGLSVTGYATVIEQMAGVLWSDLPYAGPMLNGQEPTLVMPGGDVYAPIDPVSGTIIIFIMAFTLIPLFSFFITSLFSKKEYEIKHYIIAIAVFFLSSLVFKATISHFILKVINPDQVQYAAYGLKAYGHEYSSPMAAYMKHFLNRGWTQDIPFFENYYMSIEHISDALAVFVLSGYALFARKDKYTCFGSLLLNLFTAISSTALSPLISSNFNSGFFKDAALPEWFRRIADWGVWEYGTGFFVGLFVMLFLAFTADKQLSHSGYEESPLFTDKKISFGFNLVFTAFILGVAPARVLGLRIAGSFENLGILPDDEPLGTILTIVFSIAITLYFLKLINVNILKKNSNTFDMLPIDFAKKALPAYFVFCLVAYFILDDATILRIKTDITNPLMLITAALIVITYIPVRIRLAKKQSH